MLGLLGGLALEPRWYSGQLSVASDKVVDDCGAVLDILYRRARSTKPHPFERVRLNCIEDCMRLFLIRACMCMYFDRRKSTMCGRQ